MLWQDHVKEVADFHIEKGGDLTRKPGHPKGKLQWTVRDTAKALKLGLGACATILIMHKMIQLHPELEEIKSWRMALVRLKYIRNSLKKEKK